MSDLTTVKPFVPRIFRVHGSDYYGDEAIEAPRTHTDEALAAVAALGYDGVWIHVELREVAPTKLFAPYVENAAARLAALKETAQRAQRHGMRLWLYLNEPRCYPQTHPFWLDHPECRGATGSDTAIAWRRGNEWLETYAMCTSAAPVRQFLRESMRDLLRQVPELGGAFVITASEHHTHCYSHFGFKGKTEMDCPRCREREIWEMPPEIAAALQAGIEDAGSDALLAMWTWSWNRQMQPEQIQNLLDRLPPRVALLCDFERGQTVTRLCKPLLIDEYSFAIVGPSQQFAEYHEAIRPSGREMWAKLQVNSTHEIATAPNIPVPGTLYDKVAAARADGVSGALATWSMAIRPTLNSYAAGRLLAQAGPLPEREMFLRHLACGYFGEVNDAQTEQLVEAWQGFDEAMYQYPSLMEFVYFSPINYSPAYPWKLRRERTRMARSWTSEPWGDLLEMACSTFSLGEIGQMMDEVASRWLAALPAYEVVLEPCAATHQRAREELSAARACGYFFRSCADCFLFADAVENGAPAEVLLDLIDREAETCRHALSILENDERIGWHDEVGARIAHPENVRAKIASLEKLREEVVSMSDSHSMTATV